MIILGISGIFNHDAAACLVVDGNIVSMAEEERFIRRKRAYRSMPLESTMYCLKKAKLNPEDIDILAVSWDPNLFLADKYDKNFVEIFIKHSFWNGKLSPKIEYISHHIAHASSSYYLSKIDKAVVIVIDGHSEKNSTSVGLCENNNILFEKEYPISHSLGHFYESVSEFIGLGKYAPGKMMGLAPYSTESHLLDDIFEIDNGEYNFKFSDSAQRAIDFSSVNFLWQKYLTNKFGILDNRTTIWDKDNNKTVTCLKDLKIAADIAASAQSLLERIVIDLADYSFKKYNTRNLILSGGVALNCTMNGKILSSINPDNFFVCPASNDAGGAIGAALYVLRRKVANFTPYLGPGVNKDDAIRHLGTLGLKYRVSTNIFKETASLLEQGKIIGLIQGNAEIGPRALGNRSILALPNTERIRDQVNNTKSRETWRPLSPSLTSENVKKMFSTKVESKYMLEAHKVCDSVRNKIPGIIHVDGSCRPQVVTEEDNEFYYNLLHEADSRTDIPAILNTSFNDAHEPIVSNVKDAIRTFYSTPLNTLIIEDIIVEKQ
jgi:carbamoyltransferase